MAGRTEIRLVELADRPLIFSDQGLSIRHMLGLLRSLAVTPRVAHRAASLEVLHSLGDEWRGLGNQLYPIRPAI